MLTFFLFSLSSPLVWLCPLQIFPYSSKSPSRSNTDFFVNLVVLIFQLFIFFPHIFQRKILFQYYAFLSRESLIWSPGLFLIFWLILTIVYFDVLYASSDFQHFQAPFQASGNCYKPLGTVPSVLNTISINVTPMLHSLLVLFNYLSLVSFYRIFTILPEW